MTRLEKGTVNTSKGGMTMPTKHLHGDTVGGSLARDEAVPSFGTFTDNVHGVPANIVSCVPPVVKLKY